MHLEIISQKLKQKFGVDVNLVDMKVPYRETIKKKATAEGKHKKTIRRQRPVWSCLD